MTEEELLRAVTRLCDERLLRWTHNPDSRRSTGHRGFPDLVIAGPRGTLFAELKDNRKSLTPDQRQWGSILGRGGSLWCVWRPRDLESGAIQLKLDSISRYQQEVLS